MLVRVGYHRDEGLSAFDETKQVRTVERYISLTPAPDALLPDGAI
jgi:hypothetical protein